jgi:hypothetical protein
VLDNPFSSGNITPNQLLTLMVYVDKSKYPSSAKAIVKNRSVLIGVFSVGIFLCKRPECTQICSVRRWMSFLDSVDDVMMLERGYWLRHLMDHMRNMNKVYCIDIGDLEEFLTGVHL